MKPFTIFGQPPDDTGSRKKLVNRKGNIDNVEHAYSGIVNVYALVEPGGLATIEEVSAGAMSIPSGAKLYPQQKVGKMSHKEKMELDELRDKQRVVLTHTYDWSYDTHEKRDGLYPKVGDNFISKGKTIEKDHADYYNSILRNQPELVRVYNEDNVEDAKKMQKARYYIMSNTKNIPGKKRYYDSVFRQANIMHVTTDTVEDWINSHKFSRKWDIEKSAKRYVAIEENIIEDIILHQMVELNMPDNLKAREVLKKKYGMNDEQITKKYNEMKASYILIKEEPSKTHAPEFQKPAVVIDTSILPIPIADLMKVNKDDKKYMSNVPLDTMKALYNKDNPEKSPLVYAESDGGIIYYVDPSKMSIERRKRLRQIKARRVIYRLRRKFNPKIISKKIVVKKVPKKIQCSKSSTMKKCILNKLRCKCRGKKK